MRTTSRKLVCTTSACSQKGFTLRISLTLKRFNLFVLVESFDSYIEEEYYFIPFETRVNGANIFPIKIDHSQEALSFLKTKKVYLQHGSTLTGTLPLVF